MIPLPIIAGETGGGVFTQTAGTWIFQVDAALHTYNGFTTNSSNAQNDQITFTNLFMPAGTWSIYLLGSKSNNFAIATIFLDGVSTGSTIDFFNGSLIRNVMTNTSFTVTDNTTRLHSVGLKAATRNGGNTTGWVLALSQATLIRTA